MFILRDGGEPPPFPDSCTLILLMLLLILLWWGWQIRRFKARKSSRVSAVTASRVAAFALASCYSGTLLTGLFAMMAVLYRMNGSTEYVREQAMSVALSALTSLALAVGGMVVERWCRLNRSDDTARSARAWS